MFAPMVQSGAMFPRYVDAFHGLDQEKLLASQLVSLRAELRAAWQPETGGRLWGEAHCDLVDALVRRLVQLAVERSGEPTHGIAVVATGGYGQRVLAPFSDIDLTFVVDRDDDPAVLREAFRLVMDVLLSGARIKVGYSYRHISDLEKGGIDHQTQTALLDARFLSGDRALFDRFQKLWQESIPVADFLFRKETERHRVRARFGDSPYVVEPDVKEGAGGLRDVHSALWMAQARFQKSGDALWRDLVRRRILTSDEMRQLRAGREHLWKTRHALHIVAGERRDRLAIARQELLAERFGAEAGATAPPVERWMQSHYEHASQVDRLSLKVMQRCLDAPLDLATDGLASLRRTVVVTDPGRAAANRLWPLDALRHCQEYDLELAPATVEAIEQLDSDFRGIDAGQRLLAILEEEGDVHKTFRRMERCGLLARMLPEFSDCLRLIPYDPAHAFTVGEHTLRVLANLNRLRPDAAPEPALEAYRYVYTTLESPATLILGVLLHDIGKQWPLDRRGNRAPHEATGAERIPEICGRLGCNSTMTDRIGLLVRHHLLLAEVSRLRDLSRPETIGEVLTVVPDSDMLRMLYLLTWADTSAVGPGVWSTAAARLLDELVQRCEARMGSDAPSDPTQETRRLDLLRDRLRRRFAENDSGDALDPEEVKRHTDGMPAAYLFNTSPEEMGLHLEMVRALVGGDTGNPVVTDFRGNAVDRDTEITMVAWDDPTPGLLAKVTGVLYAFDIRLHAAQVFTRSTNDGQPLVVDTLRVDHRDRGIDRPMQLELHAALANVLSGRETVGDLIARRRRPAALIGSPRSMSLRNVDGRYVLVDIRLPSGTGSIHALCRAITFCGWNIEAARLSAWAGSVRCTVYISGPEGEAGSEADRDRLEKALRAAP